MAELILTDEEKSAATWLELDDATVGKVVKKLGTGILQMASEKERMFWYSAALMLCSTAADNNSETMTVDLEGFEDAGTDLGDWRVTVQKLKPANAELTGDGQAQLDRRPG